MKALVNGEDATADEMHHSNTNEMVMTSSILLLLLLLLPWQHQ